MYLQYIIKYKIRIIANIIILQRIYWGRNMAFNVGIDIGSTTVKVVVFDGDQIVYKKYERHFSQVRQKALEMLQEAKPILEKQPFHLTISGSAGFGVSKATRIPFVQEVFATSQSAKLFDPTTDVVIELGGEDAKILFLTGGMEERMNGSCAGGTGAFIDQMATLLNVTPTELDELSTNASRIYPIASRCGVFAKSDIQPLLNQGAPKEDIAASIFQAVVDQTITGLAQGRKIEGKVLFLGGPLYFFNGLKERFVDTLLLTEENAIFPALGLYAVAMGAAIYGKNEEKTYTYAEAVDLLAHAESHTNQTNTLPPLFADEEDYEVFKERHAKATVPRTPIESYTGGAYLGIDCGSTTTKLILIGEENELLFEYYNSNKGDPVDVVKEQLEKLYEKCGDKITIKGSAVTGYGEELIKNAFSVDAGLVETMAHFRSARYFDPDVDFILDIGGQDIKCFRVRNDSIDGIMLNEACSSGCGSFVETFAKSMGYNIQDFSQLALFAKHPVDLGSRCTVFMNSSVKQAQKDGATVEDTSAGLSISVVKNVIYKVIRAHKAEELGNHVVVQGGTFLNDAVLRSFEQEMGMDVVRPDIAGLMGAYGAALYAKSLGLEESSLISPEELHTFTHTSESTVCKLCGNHCSLTVNTFANGGKFISGNKCERPNGIKNIESAPNLYQYKLKKLKSYKPVAGTRGKIGIPMVLNLMEMYPFWYAFFTNLGFEVVTTKFSTRATYVKGQQTIPSDTVCYPAKLVHGHIEELLEAHVKNIFYPCLTYNFDEEKGDNHYNCPVVAYYPELLISNMKDLKQDAHFMYPFLGIHRPKDFAKKIFEYLKEELPDQQFTKKEVQKASDAAFAEYEAYLLDIQKEGEKALDYAKQNDLTTIVLAGRPYHIDPEINHGIDKLISSFGVVVVSEDSIAHLTDPEMVNVLNQWTYHSRLYNAARYVTEHENIELIQLVSFGCGIDSITTDEVREILEDGGKFYTQLKIDEISNLGAVKIRIRSLFGAMEERERNGKEHAKRAI